MDLSLIAPDLPPNRPFTAAEARAAGVSRRQLQQLVTAGHVRHPMKGVFVPAALPDTLEVRIRCVGLILPPDAFACDHTASWLHAGDVSLPPNADLSPPQPAFFRPGDRNRLRNELCTSGRRRVIDDDLMEIRGIPVTTPLRTALDLGRLQRPDMALWGLDLMMKVAKFDHLELLAELPRFKGERGVVQLRDLAPWTDAGAESYGESALRRRWKLADLPRPRTQIELWHDGQLIAVLDMGLEEILLGAEYDGEQWHGRSRREHDEARRTWIRTERGYDLEVFAKGDVFGVNQQADFRLHAAFQRAKQALPNKRHFLLAGTRTDRSA